MSFDLSDFNTRTTSPSLGDVEIKFISCTDHRQLEKLVWFVKDDRDFTVQTLHHQFQSPKLEFEDFKNLSDIELRQLAKDYSSNELKKSLNDVPDTALFFEFRNAVDNKLRKDNEALSASLKKMSFSFSDQLSQMASAMSYSVADNTLKKINEMQQKQIESTLRGLNKLATPNIADIAGMAGSSLIADICKPTAFKDAVESFDSSSRLAKTFKDFDVSSDIAKAAGEFGLSSALKRVAEGLNVSSQLGNAIDGFSLSSHMEKSIESISLASQVKKTAANFGISTLKDVTSAMSAGLTDGQSLISKQILQSVSGQLGWTPKYASELLMPQINAMQSWAAINPGTFGRLTNFWEEFETNYNIAEYKAVRVLKKYNWFVSPSLPSSFVYDAVKLGRKRGNKLREMNSLFWDYFSDNDFENLTNMVESWSANPLFKRRMKIFRDCVATLKQAKRGSNPSNVVVPTLIAQIDGVLTKFRRQKGLIYKTHGSANQLQELKVWFEAEATNQDVLSEQMLELANYILFSILFQTAHYEKPLAIPFTLSRHKIMHGEFLTYGRRANVIRAFLILDFLAALK